MGVGIYIENPNGVQVKYPIFVKEAYLFSGRFHNEPLLGATTHVVFLQNNCNTNMLC